MRCSRAGLGGNLGALIALDLDWELSWDFCCIGELRDELRALFLNRTKRGAENIALELDWEVSWELVLELDGGLLWNWTRR